MPPQKFQGDDRRAVTDHGWHLDKKVPLSLIFAMLVQAAMVIWAIADIKKDVEVLKSQSVSQTAGQTQRDVRQDDDLRAAIGQVRESFNQLNAKLDRLIERGSGSK